MSARPHPLLAITLLLLGACGSSDQAATDPPSPPGGGGGGGGGGLGGPTAGPPTISGDPVAEPGELWVADLLLGSGLVPGGGQIVEGPPGLVLDPAAMRLSWAVPDTAQGAHQIRVEVLTPGGAETASVELYVIGMVEVARGAVDPSGGRIDIDDSASRLSGGFVDVPQGAVAAAGEVFVVETALHPLLPGSVVTAEIGPSQQFAAPVTVALPYSQDMLAEFGVAPADLGIFVWEELEGSWRLLDNVVVDTAAQLVIGETDHFSPFAVIPIGNAIISNPAVAALLVSLGLDLAGDWIADLLALLLRLIQDRELRFWQGDGSCEIDETTAVVLHGLLSAPSEFAGTGDLIDDLRQRYDNVITYQYPSGSPIATNGRWLAQELGAGESICEPGVIVDLYGHSMGGLVSRFAVEQEWWQFASRGVHVSNLTTLGTPHLGAVRLAPSFAAESPWLEAILRRLFRSNGVLDLIGGSQFLQYLNASPETGWTQYRCFAGSSSLFGIGDNDGIVDVTSAIPAGLFPIQLQGVHPQDHNELHTELQAGAGPAIRQDVRLTRFDPGQVTLTGDTVQFQVGDQPAFVSVDGHLEVRFGPGFSTPPWSAVIAGVEVTCNDNGAVEDYAGGVFFYEGSRTLPGGAISGPFTDPEPITDRTIRFDPIVGPLHPGGDVRLGYSERRFVAFSIPAGTAGTVYRRFYP